jgi:hypothetical protein
MLGPEIDYPDCINRELVCLTCGATGVQSTRRDNASNAETTDPQIDETD